MKALAWIVLVLVAGLFSFTVFWDWRLEYRFKLTWKPRKRQTPEEEKEE